MRGKLKPEIYLLYFLGLKPRHIIRLGYATSTAYSYHKRFKDAMEELIKKDLIGTDKRLKINPERLNK